MEEEKRRMWIAFKHVGAFLGTILLLIFVFQFSVYFMPFFIAGIIALMIEPIIKFTMNHFQWSRRVSSIIIITATILLLVGIVIGGGIATVGQLIKYTKNIGPFITDLIQALETGFKEISVSLEQYIPKEVITTLINSITNFVSNAGMYIQNVLGKVLEIALSVPTIILNVIVTILALIFFTKDRIYIIDLMEQHFPKKWIESVKKVVKEILATFGSYLKVYGKILMITFSELFLAFSILKAIGFPLQNTFLLALVIGIVDILPVLGVGTVLIPWGLWEFIVGNIAFGIALAIIYVIILIVRQFIEPKLVSQQLGVHPLITLFAMYTGFKLFGFVGLIFGPVLLMVLKCVFSKPLEKGFFKSWGRSLNF